MYLRTCRPVSKSARSGQTCHGAFPERHVIGFIKVREKCGPAVYPVRILAKTMASFAVEVERPGASAVVPRSEGVQPTGYVPNVLLFWLRR